MRRIEAQIHRQLEMINEAVDQKLSLVLDEGLASPESTAILRNLCEAQRHLHASVRSQAQQGDDLAPDGEITTPGDTAPDGFCTLSAQDWLCPVCSGSEVMFSERVTADDARPLVDKDLIRADLMVICEDCGWRATTRSFSEHVRRERLGLPPTGALALLRENR